MRGGDEQNIKMEQAERQTERRAGKGPVVGVVGDLLTDVVVRLEGEDIRHGTDTPGVVEYRRGGSAANLAVAAARLGAGVVFIGNVGEDERGEMLLAELASQGVKCRVTRGGMTGTVVVLLSSDGERSMLTDRGAAGSLKSWKSRWLKNLNVLHIPGYSLMVEPLGAATLGMVAKIRSKKRVKNRAQKLAGGKNPTIITLGISSVGAVQDFGVEKFWELVERVNPDYIICNSDEAELFERHIHVSEKEKSEEKIGEKSEEEGEEERDKTVQEGDRGDGGYRAETSQTESAESQKAKEEMGPAIWIITGGAEPTRIYLQAGDLRAEEISPLSLPKDIPVDTTGAGDAFTAGFIAAVAGGTAPAKAVEQGHIAAYDLLVGRQI